MLNQFTMQPIGTIQSPFKQKFGIPRQPRLTSAQGAIKLIGEANQQACIQDLELHSHIWVIFLFHENLQQGWKPQVRPPRLGGNKKTGVLATRSTFRPNGIGMSALKLLGTEYREGHWHINVAGLDLLDGTPVLDIKPYIPYSDSIVDAHSELAPESPTTLNVIYTEQARTQLAMFNNSYAGLEGLISEVLQQDPRPSYKQHKADDKTYGVNLYELNILWKIDADLTTCRVLSIEQVTT